MSSEKLSAVTVTTPETDDLRDSSDGSGVSAFFLSQRDVTNNTIVIYYIYYMICSPGDNHDYDCLRLSHDHDRAVGKARHDHWQLDSELRLGLSPGIPSSSEPVPI